MDRLTKLVRVFDVMKTVTEQVPERAYDVRAKGRLDNQLRAIMDIPAVDAVEVPQTGIGDLSDGFHTFNELYHQRAVLFAALVKAHRDRAWKSWRHSDGELPFGKEDYFIVGLDTPEGSYTYHYHGEYWDMFDCQELPRGKEWDGHTDKDVTRLLSLAVDAVEVVHGEWIVKSGRCSHGVDRRTVMCSICGNYLYLGGVNAGRGDANLCPNCGARMDGRREEEHNAAD